jgi:hypothetical protein
MDSAHRSYTIMAAPGAAGTLVYTGALILFNMCLTAPAGNAAAIILWDNTSATGTDYRFRTPASTSTQQEWEPNGFRFENGLFVTRVPGLTGWTAVITYVAE